jgi:hypothetical protein
MMNYRYTCFFYNCVPVLCNVDGLLPNVLSHGRYVKRQRHENITWTSSPIRIRIKVKSRIRILIKVMRIRNSGLKVLERKIHPSGAPLIYYLKIHARFVPVSCAF